MKVWVNISLWIISGLIILLPVILPLFTSYVPGTADGLAHKFRLVAFEREVRDGNIRPRWLNSASLGYGSPIFLYNYILPYYLIDIIYRFGTSVNLAAQIYEAMTLVLSFIFMFLLADKLWGRKAGLVAASVYVWAPYHLMTIYLYEGWGEMGAFVFPPLILYLITHIYDIGKSFLSDKNQRSKIKDQKEIRKVIFCYMFYVICYLLFILTHNVSVLIFTPVILLAALVMFKQKRRYVVIVLGGFVTACLLSSFFSLPSVMTGGLIRYQRLISFEAVYRGQYFIPIMSLVTNSIQTIKSGISHFREFSLGIPLAFVVMVSVILFIRMIKGIGRKKGAEGHKLLLTLILFFFSAVYLTNPVSSRLWQTGVFNLVVYPFRFFSVAVFCGSLIAGYTARKSFFLLTVLVILAVVSGIPYTRPYVDIFPFDNSYFQQPQTIKLAPGTLKNMAIAEFMPMWVTADSMDRIENQYLYRKIIDGRFEIEEGKGKVIEIAVKGDRQLGHISLNEKADVRVNTFYFPQWEAYLDNRKVPVQRENSGLMTVSVPGGTHKLEMVFGYSLVEKVGMMLSVIGVGLLFMAMLILIKKFR